MNVFTRSILKIFEGAKTSFKTFPASIGSAFAFALVTVVRIHLDWPEQEAWNFLFNCLHLSFAFGAIFSLASITAAQSRYGSKKAFKTANLLGILAAAVALALLYWFGGTDPAETGSRYARVTDLAAARVSVAMLISFLSFIWLAGHKEQDSDFARSFFMTHKAFFIAALYGLVIMAGTSGVAGAFEALIYNDMSSKVYMYIATIAGFLAFAIFAGYFPEFGKGTIDPHREAAQKHPRFVQVLFEFIMVPVALALTAVLLLWTGRIVLTGDWPNFVRLSGIATAYAAGGLWLHVMITRYDSALARFYRLAYPMAALVILAFEAWALVERLGDAGLKLTEYGFALVWIVAVASVVLLLVKKSRAHGLMVALICIVAAVSVLPVVGYHVLPVTAQVSRLEKLLTAEGMLRDGILTPAGQEPEEAVREDITDAVQFLAYADEAKLPDWFDQRLGEPAGFKELMGFEKTWPKPDRDMPGGGDYLGTSLSLGADAVNVEAYQWAVFAERSYKRGETGFELQGDRGVYAIRWNAEPPEGVPVLEVDLDGKSILKQDLNAYIDGITEAYPPGPYDSREADLETMSLRLETPEVMILLVFENVEINVDVREDRITYWINLKALYLAEKP